MEVDRGYLDFRIIQATPMSDSFAESSSNTLSDIIELALYSTSVLFIVLLWVYVPA